MISRFAFGKRRLAPAVRRAVLALGALAMLLSFHLVYISWLSPVYGSLGFAYPGPAGWPEVIGYLLGVIPACWMPLALKRPSQFLYWVTYVTIYLPSMLVPAFLQLRPDGEIIQLQCALAAGFALIGLGYGLRLLSIPKRQLSSRAFWTVSYVITVALLARVIFVYWGNFHLVSWKNAYDIRFTGSDLAEAAGLAYPINWLSFVFLPMFMALGLVRKQPLVFAAAAACTVLLYATQGMKHILFSSIYVAAVYYLLRRRSDIFGLRLLWCCVFSLTVFSAYVVFFDASHSEAAMLVGANVVLRVFGNGGLLVGIYHGFFADHPLTYYSHVTGVNWFVTYPYSGPLGIAISLATQGNTNNINASFWATDGIAAIGVYGIVLISMLVGFVFYALDCVCLPHPTASIALCLSQYALILINVSLFTSLITGGLVFFFLIFHFMPPSLFHPLPSRPAPDPTVPLPGA